MRKITEFKGYRFTIEYDHESEQFVTRSILPGVQELSLERALAAWSEILPFEQYSQSDKEKKV